MKLLSCLLLLAFCTSTSARSPRVRLLSASGTSALIRVGDGSPETHIKSLVNSLHTAGIQSFTFETNNDRLLRKLQLIWFDAGITDITIKAPESPSSSTYPTLDPLTARATLTGIDDELEREFARFHSHRKALVTFIYRHGFPEQNDTATIESLTRQKQLTEAQLATFLESSINDRLTLASKIDIPANPVAKHLTTLHEAQQEKAQLNQSGYGGKHPKVIANSQEVDAIRQLAIDELGAVEEALRVKIYQLGKRAKHLDFWQQLPTNERKAHTKTYQQTRDSYDTSNRRIRELNSAKEAALRSLKE